MTLTGTDCTHAGTVGGGEGPCLRVVTVAAHGRTDLDCRGGDAVLAADGLHHGRQRHTNRLFTRAAQGGTLIINRTARGVHRSRARRIDRSVPATWQAPAPGGECTRRSRCTRPARATRQSCPTNTRSCNRKRTAGKTAPVQQHRTQRWRARHDSGRRRAGQREAARRTAETGPGTAVDAL